MSDFAISVEELRGSLAEVLGEDAVAGGHVPAEPGRPLDTALFAQMAELGWLGLALPEEHGGLGLGFAHANALNETAGTVLASTPHAAVMEIAGVIARGGTAEQCERYLSALTAGSMVAALVDPVRGLGPSGKAQLVPFAAQADLLAVATPRGLALLERGAFDAAPRPAFDLTRPAADVSVAVDALEQAELIALDEAARADFDARCALAIAADAIGGALRVFAITLDYLKLRHQFDRPIGSFQALKHRAAEWKVLTDAATSLVRHAAEAMDAAAPDRHVLASSAKYYACDAYTAVCEDAVQMHGGIGFTWEHVAHLYLKRARLNQQLCGSSRGHREAVARHFGLTAA